MADQTFDSGFEALLRQALASEAAKLPLTVRPETILERAASRRGARRFGLGTGTWGRPNAARRLFVALATIAILAVTAAIGLNYIVNRQGLIGPPPSSGTPTPAASPTPLPSVQPTPPTETPEVTALLNDFLEARVAGRGAEPYLTPEKGDNEVPLLYATSSGAPYERAEFERVVGHEWPYGWMAFKGRLFAGDTVVEQLLFVDTDRPLSIAYQRDGFRTNIAPTTEDGRPLTEPSSYFDGEVSLQVGHPWFFSADVAIAKLIPEGAGPTTDGGERHGWDQLLLMADPALAATGCRDLNLTDAEALAESILSDPDNEATAPVAVSVEGADGWMMDVATTAVFCHGILANFIDIPITVHRTRLYLLDAPPGSSMRILAVEMIASESQFEYAVQAAAPLVSSIEFNAPTVAPTTTEP